MLSFDVSGATETLNRLSTLERVIDTTPPLSELGDAALPILRQYPPEAPGQRYRRTGRLGRGWAARAGGSVVLLENPVEYAGAVYGPDQRAAFAGRWPRVAELAQRVTPAVVAVYQAAIERIVKP